MDELFRNGPTMVRTLAADLSGGSNEKVVAQLRPMVIADPQMVARQDDGSYDLAYGFRRRLAEARRLAR